MKWKPLNETKTTYFQAIIAKSQGIEKWIVANLSTFRCLQTLTRLSNILPQCCGSEERQGLFPILLFHWFAETLLQIGVNSLLVQTDSGAMLLVLNPTTIAQSLP